VNARDDLIFIGDVHLDRGDTFLERFVEFLERVSRTSRRIVLMGDLFNLWIGRAELEQPHQTAVVVKLEELRGRGVFVRYLEGNRDYRVGSCYSGRALDDASDEAVVECHGGRRLVAIHGDLANPRDRHYRVWRRLSRMPLAWHAFHLLPRRRRLRLAESLERRLRTSNPDFKRSFPETVVRAYAARLLGPRDDALVLGHFHVERDLETPHGRVLVLPDWKSTRRHLRVAPDGEIGFVDSE
jgi:UDP-2,3-diacylglucosamine hydrolase